MIVATLKIFPINQIPPFGYPKENQMVLCKQFQEEFRIYKIIKVWAQPFFDIEAVFPNEFKTYNKILSTPKSELCVIGCEWHHPGLPEIGRSLRQLPLSQNDYEYAINKIGEEVEIEIEEHKNIEDDVMDGVWNYPICKIINIHKT